MITLLTYFFFVRYVLQRTFSLSVQFLCRLSLLQPSDALLLFSACELFLFSHYARNVLLLSILIQNPIQSSQFEKYVTDKKRNLNNGNKLKSNKVVEKENEIIDKNNKNYEDVKNNEHEKNEKNDIAIAHRPWVDLILHEMIKNIPIGLREGVSVPPSLFPSLFPSTSPIFMEEVPLLEESEVLVGFAPLEPVSILMT